MVVKEEDQSEIHRATIFAGKEYVERMKKTRKEVVLERIAAEKESLDATIEGEECPVRSGRASCYFANSILVRSVLTRSIPPSSQSVATHSARTV